MSAASVTDPWQSDVLVEFPMLRSVEVDSEGPLPPINGRRRSPSILPYVTARQSAASPPKLPLPLVEELIRQGDFVVIGAPRGAYKSWLMLDLGLLMASGTGSLFGVFNITRALKVLSIHGELEEWSVHRRRSLILGSAPVPSGLFDVYVPTSIRVSRVRESWYDGGVLIAKDRFEAEIDQPLERLIGKLNPDVVIIDPWASFNGGEENSNDHAEAAYKEIRRLIDEYGITVIAIHHFSQSASGTDPEDSWRGASRLADAASVRITLARTHKTNRIARDKGLDPSEAKQFSQVHFLIRRDETPSDFAIRFDTERYRLLMSADAAESGNAITFTIEQVLDAMKAVGGFFKSTNQASEVLECSYAVADRALDQLWNHGDLTKDWKGPGKATSWHPTTRWDTVDEQTRPLKAPLTPSSQDRP